MCDLLPCFPDADSSHSAPLAPRSLRRRRHLGGRHTRSPDHRHDLQFCCCCCGDTRALMCGGRFAGRKGISLANPLPLAFRRIESNQANERLTTAAAGAEAAAVVGKQNITARDKRQEVARLSRRLVSLSQNNNNCLPDYARQISLFLFPDFAD